MKRATQKAQIDTNGHSTKFGENFCLSHKISISSFCDRTFAIARPEQSDQNQTFSSENCSTGCLKNIPGVHDS